MISIRHSNHGDLNENTVNRITELINMVYKEAENDLWKPETSNRTYNAEVENFIKKDAFLIAEKNNEIVGICKIGEQDKNICEFGMLASDPALRGVGIGRDLVSAAENWGRSNGYKKMRLELLTPRHWKNESKEFLKIWYTRLGYVPDHTEPFEELFAHRIDDFATECDFTVWLKDLN